MPLRFEEKVVLVTGGSRGLGRAFTQCLAEAGAKVVFSSTGKSNSGAQAEEEMRGLGVDVTHMPIVAEEADLLVDKVVSECGRIDAIVHNGGFVHDKTLRKMSDEQWQAVVGVHLDAAFKLSRAAWPHFEAVGGGRLVFISSSAGLYGNFGQANYAAAKLGLYGLAQTIELEGAALNICANVVAPFGATELNSANMDEARKDVLKTEYVAPIVAYLAHLECTESGGLFEASAGSFKKVRWQQSSGLVLDTSQPVGIDDVASGWAAVCDFASPSYPSEMRESLRGLYEPHILSS
ncbi:MAG: SDR family NAD(P)-dependent oxidoreductase [Pseudomonadales bacterium]|nr:SDR family NAD(P)-dependent oxidoreductase [Pseudomonadales bacterium]